MATKKPKVKVNKKDIYEKEILEVIKKKFILRITDIFAFYSGCTRSNFYLIHLDKLDTIKKALDDNRVKGCQSLLSKWFKSENPTLQMAAYKIICDDEQRKKLSMQYQETDITTKGEKINISFVPFVKNE